MSADRKQRILGKPGVSMIGLGIGWFLHAAFAAGRDHASTLTVCLNLGAMMAILFLGAVLDYDG